MQKEVRVIQWAEEVKDYIEYETFQASTYLTETMNFIYVNTPFVTVSC